MKFCVVGGLQMPVLRFEFHQNRLSGFGAVGVEICPSPLTWRLVYTSACTTVQAVITGRSFRYTSPCQLSLELTLWFFTLTSSLSFFSWLTLHVSRRIFLLIHLSHHLSLSHSFTPASHSPDPLILPIIECLRAPKLPLRIRTLFLSLLARCQVTRFRCHTIFNEIVQIK